MNKSLKILDVAQPEKVVEPDNNPKELSDNPQIVRRFFLPGQTYSMNKSKIKDLLKKHWIKWCGSLDYPQWKNDKMKYTIKAEFYRENGITVGAGLFYEGSQVNKFIEELTHLLDKLGVEYNDDVVVVEEVTSEQTDKIVEKELYHWDMFNRPNVEAMKKGNVHNGFKSVPESFIEYAVADWKGKRKAKEQEIRERIKETGE